MKVKRKLFFVPVILVIAIFIVVSSFKTAQITRIKQNSFVHLILKELGEPLPAHVLQNTDSATVRMGKEIVFFGKTTNAAGKKSTRQSKFFVCTDCHNTVREDPDLVHLNPENRLTYCSQNKIPFLQGSTFFGIINRETWYNDDYLKKYGDLVKPARDTLVNAIQLCAIECSQGRLLEGWELNAVLAYFNTLGYKLKDLELSEEEIADLNSVLEGGSTEDKKEKINFLKSKYALKSPATFLKVPDRPERKYGDGANVKNGKLIYDLSCLHCHKKAGPATYKLDYNQLTFNQLKKNLDNYSNKSLYQIVRMGTYAIPGYKPYMPHYPKERLSKNQLEDLVGFVVKNSKVKIN